MKRYFSIIAIVLLLTSCNDNIFDHPQGNVSLGEVIVTLTGDDHLAGI